MREWAKGQGPSVRGNTLVEILVVIAIVGLIAGVTGLGSRVAPRPDVTTSANARIADARREAIRSGRSITFILARDGETVAATAHPDGRIIADSALRIDPSSGRALP